MYSAAVEEVMAMGEVTMGQRALLNRLRESLQLSKNDAERLEWDLGLGLDKSLILKEEST